MSVKAALEKRASSLSASYTEYFNDSFLWNTNSKELEVYGPNELRLLAIKGIEYLVNVDGKVWSKYLKDDIFLEIPKPRELSFPEELRATGDRIKKLLFRLSKFYLLKDAHYILEYLVRCFGVHRFESVAVLKCILPYHETGLFCRMVRILDFKQIPEFSFLKADSQYIGNQPLSRTRLAEEMVKHHSVLELVSVIPLSYAKTQTSFSHVYTFYTSVIIQLLSFREVSVVTLEIILQHVLSGIESNDSELQISSEMILASLATRINLNAEKYHEVEKRLVQSALPHLHYQALLTLIMIQQHKPLPASTLSDIVLKDLLAWADFERILALVAEAGEVDCEPFLACYLPALARKVTKYAKVSKHIYFLLSTLPRMSSFISKFAASLCTQLSLPESVKPNVLNTLQSCFRLMDIKYPMELQQGVSDLTKAGNGLNFKNGWSSVLIGTRHQFFTLHGVDEDGVAFDTVSTIQHSLSITTPAPMVIQAFKTLKTLVTKSSESDDDSGFSDLGDGFGDTTSLASILSTSIKSFLGHPHTHHSILLFLLRDLGRDLPALVHPTAEFITILDQLLRSLKPNPLNPSNEQIVRAILSVLSGPLLARPIPIVEKHRILIIFLRQLFQIADEKERKNVFKLVINLRHPLLYHDEMAVDEPENSRCTFESCLQSLIERMSASISDIGSALEDFVLLASRENVQLLIFTRLLLNACLSSKNAPSWKLVSLLLHQSASDLATAREKLTLFHEPPNANKNQSSALQCAGLTTISKSLLAALFSAPAYTYSNLTELTVANIHSLIAKSPLSPQQDASDLEERQKIWRLLFMLTFCSKLNEQRQQFLWHQYLEKSLFRQPNESTHDSRAPFNAGNSFFIPALSHFWSASANLGYSSTVVALALKQFRQYLETTAETQIASTLKLIMSNLLSLFAASVSPERQVRDEVVLLFRFMSQYCKPNDQKRKGPFDELYASLISYADFASLMRAVGGPTALDLVKAGSNTLQSLLEVILNSQKEVFFQFFLTLSLASELASHVRLCALHGLVPLVGHTSEAVIVTLVEYLENHLLAERKRDGLQQKQQARNSKKKGKLGEKNFVVFVLNEFDLECVRLILSLFHYNTATLLSNNQYLFSTFCRFLKESELVFSHNHGTKKRTLSAAKANAMDVEDSQENSAAPFSCCLYLLGQINPAFFSLLSFARQQELFSILCSLLLPSSTATASALRKSELSYLMPSIKEAVRRVLKIIPPSSHLVDTELKECASDISSAEKLTESIQERDVPNQKRSKLNAGKTLDTSSSTLDAAKLAERVAIGKSKLIVLLETHEFRPNLFNFHHVEYLFVILKHFVDPEVESDITAEYTQQLLLKSLTVICQSINESLVQQKQRQLQQHKISQEKKDDEMEVEDPPEELAISTDNLAGETLTTEQAVRELQKKFSIDALIEIMQINRSPLIQNECLLLLIELAKLFPPIVFENMMNICLFLGASAKGREDQFTLTVIQRTIESIVPALLSSDSGKGIGIVSMIEEIVSQFHLIPEHRKLLFFSVLLRTLGDKYIPLLFITIISHSLASAPTVDESSVDLSSKPNTPNSKNAPRSPQQQRQQQQREEQQSQKTRLMNFIQLLCLKSNPEVIMRSLLFLLQSLEKHRSRNKAPDAGEVSASSATIKDALYAIVRKYAHKYYIARNPSQAAHPSPNKPAKGGKKASAVNSNDMVLDGAILSPKEEQESDFFVFQLLSAIVEVLVSYLGSSAYENQMLTVASMAQEKIQMYYLNLFQLLMNFIHALSLELHQSESDETKKKSEVEHRLFLATRKLCETLIDKVNNYLTLGNFITVTATLLKNNQNPKIRNKALIIFNDKITASSSRTPAHSVCMKLMKLLGRLVDVVARGDLPESEQATTVLESDAVVITKQNACLSIDILARWLASVSDYSEFFIEIIPSLLSEFKTRTANRLARAQVPFAPINGPAPKSHVESSLILVLAMLTTQLSHSPSLLPHINDLFSAFLGCLRACGNRVVQASPTPEVQDITGQFFNRSRKKKQNRKAKQAQEMSKDELLLVLAGFSSIKSVMTKLGRFFNHFIGDLITVLLNPIFSQQSVTTLEASELFKLIVSSYTCGEVLPHVDQSYANLVLAVRGAPGQTLAYYQPSFTHFFLFLTSVYRKMNTADIQREHKEVFQFFKRAFDLRFHLRGRVERESHIISEIEGMVLLSLAPFVVNLTDKTFRPLFFSLIAWLEPSSLLLETEDTGNANANTLSLASMIGENESEQQCLLVLQKYRRKMFYRVVFKLTELLHNIFVPYYEHLMPFILTDLSREKDYEIIQFVLDSLRLCFLHDQSKFLSVDRFEKLLPPLIQSLDNIVLNEGGYKALILTCYSPCVIQLIVNLANEELWKALNFQLLQLTRSDQSELRWASLTIITEIYSKIGEPYLSLLPESMPYLFEILEDPNDEVEQVVNKLKSVLANLLGEEKFRELLQ